jgi:hypothetical protein
MFAVRKLGEIVDRAAKLSPSGATVYLSVCLHVSARACVCERVFVRV